MKKGILIFFMCSYVQVVCAWWEAGHMIVANIAYQQLNRTARDEVNKLLPLFAIEGTQAHQYEFDADNPVYTFMAISHWPDDIKSEPNFLTLNSAWHYIEDAYATDGTSTPSIKYEHSIVWAIKHLSKHVGLKSANGYDRARSLAFLIHFVADIHQPLHCTELFSSTFPKGDLGGNWYQISYLENNGDKIDNLHALWDSAIDLYPQLGYPYNVSQPVAIAAIAKQIMEDIPASSFGDEVTEMNPSVWEKGSHRLGIAAHETIAGEVPNATYIMIQSRVVERQLALAGYRLAHLLNQLT